MKAESIRLVEVDDSTQFNLLQDPGEIGYQMQGRITWLKNSVGTSKSFEKQKI